MRIIALAFLVSWMSLGCDDLVVQEPDAAPVSVDAGRNWQTAAQAVTSECSSLCRWDLRCVPGTVLEDCETSCESELCAEGDCDQPPSGSDDTIAKCSHYLWLEATSTQSCEEPAPYMYTDACRAAVRP